MSRLSRCCSQSRFIVGASLVLLSAAPAKATLYYASNCDKGSVKACVPGADANPGTSAAMPLRTCAAIQRTLDTLGPGDRMQLARGAAWTSCALQLRSPFGVATRATNPIVLAAYTPAWGAGKTKPRIVAAPGAAAIGIYGNSGAKTQEQGYRIRDLEVSGYAGVVVTGGVKWVTIDNLTMDGALASDPNTGFNCLGYTPGAVGGGFTRQITVRNSTIKNWRNMGIFAQCSDALYAKNRITRNGEFNNQHQMYIASPLTFGVLVKTDRVTVRSNIFRDGNVRAPGSCVSVVLVAHGALDRIVIEDNRIEETVVPKTSGCYGIGVGPAWPGLAEYETNVIVRRNVLRNFPVAVAIEGCGNCAIDSNTAHQPNYPYENYGLLLRANVEYADAKNAGLRVVNNFVVYSSLTTHEARGIVLSEGGAGNVISGNRILFAGGAVSGSACFDERGTAASYSAFDKNICAASGGTQPRWDVKAGTLAMWRTLYPDRDANSTNNPLIGSPAQ